MNDCTQDIVVAQARKIDKKKRAQHLPPTNFQPAAGAWDEKAKNLLHWAKARLINRSDCYGLYFSSPDGNPLNSTVKKELTDGLLLSHWSGKANRIGVHTYDQEGMGKWLCIDIDAHVDAIETNWDDACEVIERCLDFGVVPLVEHSNGKFGFHIWVLFKSPVPCQILRSIGCWLAKGIECEVFPKQVTPKEYGNYVRLPGRHHKNRSWHSEIYDVANNKWWAGEAAVKHMTATKPVDVDLFPQEAKEYVVVETPQEPANEPTAVNIEMSPDDRLGQAKQWLDSQPPTKQGEGTSGADGYFYRIAIKTVWGFGLTEERAVEILSAWGQKPDHVDEHGHPWAWSLHEVKHKVKSAMKVKYEGTVGDMLSVDHSAIDNIPAFEIPSNSSPLVDPYAFEDQSQPKASSSKSSRKRQGFTADQLADWKEAEWLVKGHVLSETIGVVYGDSTVGKSFFMLDMAMCIVTGTPFLGVHPVKQGSVVYVCSEAPAGIKKRIRAWLMHHGQTDFPKNLCVIPHRFNLQEREEAEEIIQIAKETLGQDPVWFVVDTLAKNLGAASENDAESIRSFNDNIEYIREVTKAAVDVVHHIGKDSTKGPRGHSSLRGDYDRLMSLESTKNGQGALVAIQKVKDEEVGESYTILRKIITIEPETVDRDAITSLAHDLEDGAKHRYRLLSPTAKELLGTLITKATTGKPFRHKDATDWSGKPQGTTSKVLATLVQAGFVARNGQDYTVTTDHSSVWTA